MSPGNTNAGPRPRKSAGRGRHRLVAEPPHVQASMLFLPSGAITPAAGTEVDVQARFTATTSDRTVIEG